MKKQKHDYRTYIIYTFTFLLLLPIVFLPFLLEGKSFVWKPDGLDQHFQILLYYGNMLRELIAGHGFAMVDFRIGLGFDTITTLSYYVLGDPIALLSVFMTKENSVFFYEFLIILRFYLAGISFIILMKFYQKDSVATIPGALIYVFSGYPFYLCLRHPYFMNPLIYLPLLIIGVELVLRRKKPHLMIVMIFISVLSNFYFFFILTIIMMVYIIFRYITLYHKDYKNSITGFFYTVLRTGSCYLLGIGLASFLLLPVIYAFMNNGRLSGGPKMLTGYLNYDPTYYIALLQSFFTTGTEVGYSTILSYSFVVIVSFTILLCNKKYWKLQISYVLILLGLTIPAFGYFMNGLSYVTNRWSFVLGLLVAITFCITYERIFQLGKKEIGTLILLLMTYGLLVFVFPSKHSVTNIFYYLLAFVILVLILQLKIMRDRKKLSRIIIFVTVFISLGVNANILYSANSGNYVNQFLSGKTVEQLTFHGAMSQLSNIEDDSLYRIDSYNDNVLNEALNLDLCDVSGYYSLMDGSITSYLKDLEDLSQVTAYRFDNMDNRTIIDTLAGVKYFVTDKKAALPYGYTLIMKIPDAKKVYYLYRNNFALPIGYTYDSYLLKKDYNQLTALEKQSSMLKSVVLEEDTDYADKLQTISDYGITKLEPIIITDPQITLTDKLIKINQRQAKLKLQCQTVPDSEIYIRFDNLEINNEKGVCYNIFANSNQGPKKKINVRNIYYNSYFGKKDYLINMGQSTSGKYKAIITFPEKQSFRYGSIDIYSVDMNYYQSRITSLKHNSLNHIKKSNNCIQGDIHLDYNKVLLLSIPYSKGWSAYVDGEKRTLCKGNIMYMALPLEAGTHHIVLKYETPFLKLGILISIILLVALCEIKIYLNWKAIIKK